MAPKTKKRTHYAVDDKDIPDMIFSACGIPLYSKSYFRAFIDKIRTNQKRGHTIASVRPAEVNCSKCMKSKIWRSVIAKSFVNRMKT